MTPEAQLTTLLEWMGWGFEVEDGKQYWSHADHPEASELPPLTLDLMAEAEDKLCDEGDISNPAHPRYRYSAHIYNLVPVSRQPIRATKEQRLEALLKTINKWTDE